MNVAHASIFKRQWFQVGISLLFAVVFLAMAFLPMAAHGSQNNISTPTTNNSSAMVNSSTITRAEAGSIFSMVCGGLGYNMEDTSSWGRNFGELPLEDKPNRRFTIQEAFGNSLKFVAYYGEGEGEDLVKSKESKPPEFVTVDMAKLESERNMESCFFSRLLVSVATGGFWFADALTMISQFIVSKAFDPNLVCNRDETSVSDDSCLDLITVIGGESDNDDNSIIGSLTNSLYFPLLTIAAILVGGWIFYKGIVQRKLREAFGGFIWCVLTIILGGIAVLNPVMLTKAPMTVSSVASNCILGAFSGQDCVGGTHDGVTFDGGSQDGKSGSELVCASAASGTGYTDQMQLTIGSVTCQIWKSFVLNPYSIASFGVPFDDLDTKDGEAKGAEFVAAAEGVNPDDFCVNLSSSRSAEDMKNETLILDSSSNGGRVCNIAAYQLYLMTNAESDGDSRPENGEIDERWYKIIEVAGSNDDMWSAWTSSGTSAMNKFGFSLISMFVTTAGNLVIFITGIFAMVYYISGIILMAFAPIFLLIGVHPGRGKKIMLGWMEKVISNVLKYIISAAFVVVTVGIYGGVLSSNSSPAMTIIFVIIVTMALLMYRKEFTEMLGRANMGGEQISNRMADTLGNKAQGGMQAGRQLAQAGLGGAIGSKAAGGSVKGGFSAGVKRDLKRGTGFIANTAREHDNVKNNTRRNLESQVSRGQDIKRANREDALKQSLSKAGYDENVNPKTGIPNGNGTPIAGGVGGGSPAQNQRGRAENIESEMKNATRDYDGAKQDMEKAEGKEKDWNSYINARNEIAVDLKGDEQLLQQLVTMGKESAPNMSDNEILHHAKNSVDLFIESDNLKNEDNMLAGKISALNSMGKTDEAEALQSRRNEIRERSSEIDRQINPGTYKTIENRLDKVSEERGIRSPEAQSILSKLDTIKSNANSDEVKAFDDYNKANFNFNAAKDLAQEYREQGDNNKAASLEKVASGHASEIKNIEATYGENANFNKLSELNNHLEDTKVRVSSGEGVKEAYEATTADKFEAGARVVAAKSAIDGLQRERDNNVNTDTSGNNVDHDHNEHHAHNVNRDIGEKQFDTSNHHRQARTRSEIELENTEQLLEGLHPDEGLTRRKLKKLRKEAAIELEDEGYVTDSVRYARQRSRQDVRGEKLFDDSRGIAIEREEPNYQQNNQEPPSSHGGPVVGGGSPIPPPPPIIPPSSGFGGSGSEQRNNSPVPPPPSSQNSGQVFPPNDNQSIPRTESRRPESKEQNPETPRTFDNAPNVNSGKSENFNYIPPESSPPVIHNKPSSRRPESKEQKIDPRMVDNRSNVNNESQSEQYSYNPPENRQPEKSRPQSTGNNPPVIQSQPVSNRPEAPRPQDNRPNVNNNNQSENFSYIPPDNNYQPQAIRPEQRESDNNRPNVNNYSQPENRKSPPQPSRSNPPENYPQQEQREPEPKIEKARGKGNSTSDKKRGFAGFGKPKSNNAKNDAPPEPGLGALYKKHQESTGQPSSPNIVPPIQDRNIEPRKTLPKKRPGGFNGNRFT